MRHDHLDRELQLMLLLTENRTYTVDQLCRRLGLSHRTLYYYLEFFRQAGFTVEKHGTCYSLDKQSDFFRRLFRTVHFTEDEAIALRRLLEHADAHSLQVQHLKKKLDHLYDLDILQDVALSPQHAQCVGALYEAVKMKKCVVLHGYSSPHSDTQTDRIVEPYLFLNQNNDIRCYELTTRQNKTFRISRMQSVEPLADDWTHEADHRPMFTDLFGFTGEQLLPVCLRLGRLSHNVLVEEYPRAEAFVRKDDDHHWRFEAEVCSYTGIGRFVIGLYEDIKVVDSDDFNVWLAGKIRSLSLRLPRDPALLSPDA